MSMRVIHCEQGSPEWHQARAGVITASMFRIARSKMKSAREGKRVGDPTDDALNYAFRVAVERISGKPLDEGFETWQMRRGHDLEPAARAEHEIQAGVVVQRAGFVMTEDGRFGASADGLIPEQRAGSEYKCLVSPDGLRKVLLSHDIAEFTDQIQGCMWLTGCTSWHFALYCPALESIGRHLTWFIVPRDDDYINALETDLWAFKALVDQNEAMLRALAANSDHMALAA